jgi:hypothetical protein
VSLNVSESNAVNRIAEYIVAQARGGNIPNASFTVVEDLALLLKGANKTLMAGFSPERFTAEMNAAANDRQLEGARAMKRAARKAGLLGGGEI